MEPARRTRVALVVLETLTDSATVASGPALIATNRLGMPAELSENSPFGSCFIPGLVLLVVGSSTWLARSLGCVAIGGTLRLWRWRA